MQFEIWERENKPLVAERRALLETASQPPDDNDSWAELAMHDASSFVASVRRLPFHQQVEFLQLCYERVLLDNTKMVFTCRWEPNPVERSLKWRLHPEELPMNLPF